MAKKINSHRARGKKDVLYMISSRSTQMPGGILFSSSNKENLQHTLKVYSDGGEIISVLKYDKFSGRAKKLYVGIRVKKISNRDLNIAIDLSQEELSHITSIQQAPSTSISKSEGVEKREDWYSFECMMYMTYFWVRENKGDSISELYKRFKYLLSSYHKKLYKNLGVGDLLSLEYIICSRGDYTDNRSSMGGVRDSLYLLYGICPILVWHFMNELKT